jgi:hypothetical protein
MFASPMGVASWALLDKTRETFSAAGAGSKPNWINSSVNPRLYDYSGTGLNQRVSAWAVNLAVAGDVPWQKTPRSQPAQSRSPDIRRLQPHIEQRDGSPRMADFIGRGDVAQDQLA